MYDQIKQQICWISLNDLVDVYFQNVLILQLFLTNRCVNLHVTPWCCILIYMSFMPNGVLPLYYNFMIMTCLFILPMQNFINEIYLWTVHANYNFCYASVW
jgi:hypothetical protein